MGALVTKMREQPAVSATGILECIGEDEQLGRVEDQPAWTPRVRSNTPVVGCLGKRQNQQRLPIRIDARRAEWQWTEDTAEEVGLGLLLYRVLLGQGSRIRGR
jgi:hypothetical protein